MTEENIQPVPGVKPGSFAAWCASFRPKTLGIAAAPVIVGLSVSAAVTHTFDLIVAFATLALSLLMQAIRGKVKGFLDIWKIQLQGLKI